MLIWNFHPTLGGAEQQCLRLSTELAGRGTKVLVVTKGVPGRPASETLGGIAVHRVASLSRFRGAADRFFARLGIRGPAAAAGRLRALSKARNALVERLPRYAFMAGAYLKLYRLRSQFDIVHIHEAHWIASIGAVFAARNGKPAIIKEASSGEYLRLNFSTQLLPSATRRSAVFIAISKRIAGELRESVPDGERIRIIPNGVAVPARAWSPPAGERYVLFVGNLGQQPYKGIDILLRAWRIAKDRGADARLVLLGGGDGTALRALCGELGIGESVEFKGSVRNVEDHMAEAALYVLPSRIEGMSNSLLEAMALGMPVVSTRISGSEDLIVHGENGLLVPGEDPAAMAEAILDLLADPARAAGMGRRARLTIEGGYTMPVIAARYENLYQSLSRPRAAGGAPTDA